MLKESLRSLRGLLKQHRSFCVTLVCLFLPGIILGCHPTQERNADPLMAGHSPRPLDADPYRAEFIGREALAKIGYVPIMNLAREAGWVTRKKKESARSSDPALIAQTAGPGDFVEVFSKYAVVAGVTSQADSPLPGPGDAAAIGIIVLGLIDAGLLAGAILHSIEDATSATTSSPPSATTMPMATAMPTATTSSIVTTMPIANDRKEVKRRCNEMYTDCLETPRADGRSGFHATRCLMCSEVCVKNGGEWPVSAQTATGSVRCDY